MKMMKLMLMTKKSFFYSEVSLTLNYLIIIIEVNKLLKRWKFFFENFPLRMNEKLCLYNFLFSILCCCYFVLFKLSTYLPSTWWWWSWVLQTPWRLSLLSQMFSADEKSFQNRRLKNIEPSVSHTKYFSHFCCKNR